MNIAKVTISKFRSVQNGTFEVNGILAVVGQNNAGKSAVLRALNSFFNPDTELHGYLDGSNLFTKRQSVPKIRITFRDLPAVADFTPFILNDRLTVQQSFNRRRNRLEYHAITNTRHVVSEEFLEKLMERIQFVLIPNDRDARNLGTRSDSILRKLVEAYLANHTARRDSISPRIDETFRFIDRNAFKAINNAINARFLGSKSLELTIGPASALSYDLFLRDLVIYVAENGAKFSIEHCGSGVQSLATVAIYRYLATLNHSNFIIGLEEPEVNLHPQAQRELISAFKQISETDGTQFVLTTHSTVIVDQLEHSDIALVRKETAANRSFVSVINQVPSDFWVRYRLDSDNYVRFFRYRNSDFFFANHVVVTESSTDTDVIRQLTEQNGIALEKFGYSFVNLEGVRSLKYAFHLLRHLKIPYTIVLDKDFFFEYSNINDKETSRNHSGFFKYSRAFKSEPLIDQLITSATDRTKLRNLLHANHSRAMELLEKYQIICMKYNLEMDLISSGTAQRLLYASLGIPPANQSTRTLLVTYRKKIKNVAVLIGTVSMLSRPNYPNSFKRLVRRFRALTNVR